ncbi:MAG: hypothetical protein M1445_09410 [Bacteroidetes bacterium]|nr:hypothetical protein [Bacteroidota bacterium]MCL6102796.1 hypothetical protein [Bacteroidota bacterium]
MISKEKRFFLKKALLFCSVLIGVSLLLYDTLLKEYYLKVFPLQFGIVALITLLSHLKLMNASERNPRKFSTTYLSIMSVRLLIYLVFILVCLLIDRTNAVNFVVTFLVLYLAFTIFEVIEILNFLKKNPKSSN